MCNGDLCQCFLTKLVNPVDQQTAIFLLVLCQQITRAIATVFLFNENHQMRISFFSWWRPDENLFLMSMQCFTSMKIGFLKCEFWFPSVQIRLGAMNNVCTRPSYLLNLPGNNFRLNRPFIEDEILLRCTDTNKETHTHTLPHTHPPTHTQKESFCHRLQL